MGVDTLRARQKNASAMYKLAISSIATGLVCIGVFLAALIDSKMVSHSAESAFEELRRLQIEQRRQREQMKVKLRLFTPALLLLTAFAYTPVQAQTNCDDIEFTGAISERFPNANNACMGIVERDGKEFARFNAEIQRVAGNNVSVRFNMPDGGQSETFSFDMPASARVEVDGRQYRYRELGRGSEIDVYVPHDRWEVHVPHTDDFTAAENVAVATPTMADNMSSGSTAMLPATASPLPLIGLMGTLMTGLGIVLLGIRRRLFK